MTYLLDTNVVSELRRPRRTDLNVRRWAGQVDLDKTYISVITVLEIERGAVMVAKRDPTHSASLRTWLYRDVLPSYDGRLLAIDIDVATQCARFGHVQANHLADALLAATALVHGLTLVTRNVGDFLHFAVPVFDPWSQPV